MRLAILLLIFLGYLTACGVKSNPIPYVDWQRQKAAQPVKVDDKKTP